MKFRTFSKKWSLTIACRILCFLVLCTAFSIRSFGATPPNDNCSTAQAIAIPDNGYKLGKFSSSEINITDATRQNGETFAPAILVASQTDKSVWFKFTIPTTRSVRVTLKQSGIAIAAGDVGFTVYKGNKCLPANADISTKLTPIALFGETYHPCVEPGEYYIQVSAKSKASGPLSVQLELGAGSPAPYDTPKDAYDFGKLTNYTTHIDYDVECQSVDNANEVCTAGNKKMPFTKSTWHTFTTPAYFDYLAVLLAPHNYNIGRNVFGYKLYKGNAKTTPLSSLTVVDGCDSLVTNNYYADYKTYKCGELQPNTTYTVQLFFKEEFNEKIRVAVSYSGLAATKAPEPLLSKIPAGNKLGKLKTSATGETTTVSDNLACNSRHSTHPCGYALPGAGVKFNNYNYNLSTFFTFTLSTTAKVDFNAYNSWCDHGSLLVRLYNKDVTADCNALAKNDLVKEFTYNTSIDCLPAGTYTLQVLGIDSAKPKSNYYYGSLGTNSYNPLCLQTHLGTKFDLSLRVYTLQTTNNFGLAKKGEYNAINVSGGSMKPLKIGQEYQAAADTFGCESTVLPDKGLCKSPWMNQNLPITKAMYRELVVGDSGVLFLSNQSYSFGYKLFKGEAHALTEAQNKFKYPEKFTGLTEYSKCLTPGECLGRRVCVVPGTYTYVTFGNETNVGGVDKPYFKLATVETMFSSPAKAENMGNILDSAKKRSSNSLVSAVDRYSCRDNAVTINGTKPCDINGKPATKAIYRQFYLSKAASISISSYRYEECGWGYSGYLTLFSGKATDGISGLKEVGGQWSCFNSAQSSGQCNTLPAGWYTVVSYGVGPSYAQPLRDLDDYGGGGYTYYTSQITINITQPCESPEYNRPYKAAVDSVTKKPFQIKWGNRVGSTTAYPRTDTTHTLYTEHFDCTVDTPFLYVKACNNTVNRVAYYVFQTTQEAYVNINTRNYWGAVYALDVRKDSMAMKTATPIQPCIQSEAQIELCKLQPGTYTLVLFAGDNNICQSVAPIIYIDQIGYSRFDHAANAYDFGVVSADSAWHKGKVGDVNPLNKDRAPSNDFFYCTTGAQEKDPNEAACNTVYTPEIYKSGNNIYYYDEKNNPQYRNVIPRRNLWYTFVVDKGGWVKVKVKNKTPGKTAQHLFSVYRSNVDGTLPFSEVVSKGEVDSTVTKGLTFIGTNFTGSHSYYCGASGDEVKFYRDPCNTTPERYYIIVESRSYYYYNYDPTMNPNSQVEVEILLDSVNSVQPKFDHYYQAYDFGKIGAGKYKGEKDNVSCATADETDPVTSYQYCAKKTIWYKFTTTVTGNVRYRMHFDNQYDYSAYRIQLLQQVIPGDSTSKGLKFQGAAQVYDAATQSYWAQACVSAGTYYLLITGCDLLNQTVYPEIEIIEQAGDYCSAPMVAKITGAGQSEARVIVDCHTIGTDYGEFGPRLTCPVGVETSQYKSSWFRIDITGKDTLDVTAFIVENTGAASSEIKYRMMTGDCGAMQEQSCVEDALTQNTYECLAPGRSYYIQVLTPLLKNGYPVTGDINLKLSAIKHVAKCSPPPSCLANANFQTEFDCTKDTSVRFVNYSTYGSSIKYTWDFGYGNKTSSEVSPAHFFPALATDKNYKVRLIVENTACGEKDTTEATVSVPARPYLNLGADTSLCTPGAELTLRATSHTGATYSWNYGGTDSLFKAQGSGYHQIIGKVAYKGCAATDTINVFINGMEKKAIQNLLLCGETVSLSAYHGQGEQQYRWSTGESGSSITVRQPGTYWVDLKAYGCTIRDTFVVATVEDARPLGNDTIICLTEGGYTLNATLGGASSYRWQDGSSGATHTITKGGTYWVDITVNNCTLRDTITVTETEPPVPVITGNPKFCAGDSTLLDAGAGFASYLWSTGETTQKIYAKSAGTYRVTVTNATGCAATAPAVAVVQNKAPTVNIRGNRPLCDADVLRLDAGSGFAAYLWNTGETTQSIETKSAGIYRVTVTDKNGCSTKDSAVVFVSPPAKKVTTVAAICQGQTYALPSGRQVNATGVYEDTLRNISGCDSLITTVNLVVNAVKHTSVTAAVCTGQSYTLPSGRVVNQSGAYREVFSSASGCDSIITVTLQVQDILRSTTSATICFGQNYTLPSGRVVSTGGSYADTLKTAAGCDSVVTTKLTVQEKLATAVAASICAGQTYTLPSGKVVQEAGTYTETLPSAAGCDSTVTLTLKVLPVIREAISASICSNQGYTLPSGKLVTAAGGYTDTVRFVSGCDSLITTLTLNVAAVSRKTVAAATCAGTAYTLPSGQMVTKAGIYMDTLVNAAGCDSIITTNLVVHPIQKTSIRALVCYGQSYTLPSGRVVTSSGVYKDTLTAASGCDSLVTVTVSVQKEIRTVNPVVICQGQTYQLPSGRTVQEAGTYEESLKAAGGCDSIVITQLAVQASRMEQKTATICEGQTYALPSGVRVSQSGRYHDTLRTTAGCDSLITVVDLTVEQKQLATVAASICEGQTYTLPSGVQVNRSGEYQDTLRSVLGCDSIITTTTLTVRPRAYGVNPLNGQMCIGERIQLTAYGGERYRWIPDSLTNTPEAPAIWVAPEVTSSYKVVIWNEACRAVDTVTATVTVNPLPVVQVSKSNDINCVIGISKLQATGGVGYQWSPVTGLSNPRIASPVASPAATTTYKVRVTSEAGCTAEGSINVAVVPGPGLYDLPNAFTPDGDGKNDCFGVKTWGAVSNFSMQIFSRWGELLYQTSDPAQCWDGTFKGQKLPTAVCIYIVKATTHCGPVLRKGTVTLIR